mmetsp:Transcript_19785/g.68666  ORF Transcript_19785/g.68666 Transcript_19785/m.68666 type:complete len:148 (-) Transcript_19785:896-1339(-)
MQWVDTSSRSTLQNFQPTSGRQCRSSRSTERERLRTDEATQIRDLNNVAAMEGAALPTAAALRLAPKAKLDEEAVAGCQADGLAWGSGSAGPPSREPPSRSSEREITEVNGKHCMGLSVGKMTGLNFGFRMRRFFGVLQFSMSAACP